MRTLWWLAAALATVWVVAQLLAHGQNMDASSALASLLSRSTATTTTTTTTPPSSEEETPPTKEESDEDDRSSLVHVVFSTDCSSYQDWQTEVVFHSATLAGHRGPVTRIASGCSPPQRQRLEARYATLYGGNAQYSAHFTPAFDEDAATGEKYKFYNKPRGLEHWLSTNDNSTKTQVIALIDPDFIFLRPLSDTLDRQTLKVTSPWKLEEAYERAERGRPVAQQYGLGSHWVGFDRERICGSGSPCLDVDRKEAAKYYPVGPPYLLHRDDWQRLAPVWTRFAPKVYAQYPNLLAEMYAYCMAAAHLRLRHLRVNHMMLSNVHANDEAWHLVDNLPSPCGSGSSTFPASARQRRRLPNFVHFCQNYRVGEWMFAKRRVPAAMFTDCDVGLLAEAPANVTSLDYELHPPGNPCAEPAANKPLRDRRTVRRTAFVMCLATRHANAAASTARKTFCDADQPPAKREKLFDIAMRCHRAGGRAAAASKARRQGKGAIIEASSVQILPSPRSSSSSSKRRRTRQRQR